MSNFPKNFETEIVSYDNGDVIKNLQSVSTKKAVASRTLKDAPFKYTIKELCGFDACESLIILDSAGVNVDGTLTAIDTFLQKGDNIALGGSVLSWSAEMNSDATKLSCNGIAGIGLTAFAIGLEECEGFIVCVAPFNFVE